MMTSLRVGDCNSLHIPGRKVLWSTRYRTPRDVRGRSPDELGHAAFLTDVIIDLGGEPTTTPKDFSKPDGLKEMLEVDLEMEKGDIKNYQKHAQMAEELGYVELQIKLEEMAGDEAGHARQLRRILKGL